MKKVIRYSTFETNSSSMHSMVISQENMPLFKNEIKVHAPSTIMAKYGEYGGEFSVKCSLEDKLNYFYTAMILNIDDEDGLERFYERKRILRKLFRERNILLDFQKFTLVRDPDSLYKQYAPIPDEAYSEHTNYIDINHYGELVGFLDIIFNSENLLEKLFFNENSFIVTGSDSDDDIWAEISPPLAYPARVFIKGN